MRASYQLPSTASVNLATQDRSQVDMSNYAADVVDADNQTLLRQAPMTTSDYMQAAISDIDAKLGKGFARAHPELIAAYMQTAAIDLGAAVIARALDRLRIAD